MIQNILNEKNKAKPDKNKTEQWQQTLNERKL